MEIGKTINRRIENLSSFGKNSVQGPVNSADCMEDCLDCCRGLQKAVNLCTDVQCRKRECCTETGICVDSIRSVPPLACFLPETIAARPPPPLVYANSLVEYQSSDINKVPPAYFYKEPEENFVSIEDAKIKNYLMQIGLQQQQKLRLSANRSSHMDVVGEIIDLVDEEEPSHRSLPNKRVGSVIAAPKGPKGLSPAKSQKPSIGTSNVARVIAEIDLIESSDSEPELEINSNSNEINNSDDEEDEEDCEKYPMAASAVSCELQLDELPSTAEHNDDVTILPTRADSSESDKLNNVANWPAEGVKGRSHLYQCLLCGKTVQSNYNLRRHMMIHTGERPFACNMCDRRFREFSDLKKHRRRHTNDPNFTCMICLKRTPSEQDSTRCAECESKNLVLKAQGTALAATTAAIKHSRELTETEPQLTVKPSNTENQEAFLKLDAVINNSFKTYSAEKTQADNELSISDTLLLLDKIPAVHRPSSNQFGVITRKEFPCPLCQRAFGTRHNLKRHFMIHTGEKPFSCTQCRKPFREYSTLKKHIVTHQRERWYKCLRCPQKFRDYLEYTEHKRAHPDVEHNGDCINLNKRLWPENWNGLKDSSEDSDAETDNVSLESSSERWDNDRFSFTNTKAH